MTLSTVIFKDIIISITKIIEVQTCWTHENTRLGLGLGYDKLFKMILYSFLIIELVLICVSKSQFYVSSNLVDYYKVMTK